MSPIILLGIAVGAAVLCNVALVVSQVVNVKSHRNSQSNDSLAIDMENRDKETNRNNAQDYYEKYEKKDVAEYKRLLTKGVLDILNSEEDNYE